MVSTTMIRKLRSRQDLSYVPDFERNMNDHAADELYEQILLKSLRCGTDPNEKVTIEEFEGYVVPICDTMKEAKVEAAHKETLREIILEREHIIKTLRGSEDHQQLPPFDRLLLETEYWAGLREWITPSQNAHGRRYTRLSQNENTEDSTGFEMMHLTTTPSYIRGTLRSYQLEGVNWLLGLYSRAINGILADEMGLGKTFQTIATIAYLKYTVGLPGPHLVVCPKSVIGNWFREFKQWCPTLSVFKFHATSEMRGNLIKRYLHPTNRLRYDVVVTTFEMVLDESSTFNRIPWQYLIVDEAHKLKNDEGKVHMALDSLNTSHRLMITGTPLQNNLKELWALLHFLAPRLFNDSGSFDAWFNTQSGQQDDNAMSNIHKILAPLMLRRLKADVNTGIPQKKEIYVSCSLTRKQREWYMHVLAKDAEVLNKSTGSAASLQNVLMNLRKVINHPYLMDGGEEGPPFVTDEKIVKTSGKMIILDKLLHRLQGDAAGRHQVLLFSQFTTMLDILEDYCTMRGIKYCRIDGNTSGYERDAQMASFNAPNSDYFLFLLSTRAGGLGINLQAANHVIIYDSDWNPQMDLQAQDRAHRIGQKRSVRVYRFVTDGTVEEKIYRRALKKLYLDAIVVQQGRLQSKSSKQISKDELLSMIKFGAEEIFKSRQEDVTEADIDRLLSEGEERNNLLASETKQQVQMSLASFELGAEEANIYDFEGMSYKTGVESRMLHIKIPSDQSISQNDLQALCSAYGEVIRVVLHPNLSEALVNFRTTSGALEAKEKLPFETKFASRDSQTVVTAEMVREFIGVGEKLGRGHRVREPTQFFTEEDMEKLQSKTSKAPPLKLPKSPKFPPFQLFNIKRLSELHDMEVACMVRNWKRKYQNDRDENEKNDESSPQYAPIGNADKDEKDEGLTEIELEEREQLINEGFRTWSFGEYRSLIRIVSSGEVDIDDYPRISQMLGTGKTVGEVRDYISALLDKGQLYIPKFARQEARIRKAQEKRKAKEQLLFAAKQKVESCENPCKDLVFKGRKSSEFERNLFLKGYDSGFNMNTISSIMQDLPEYRYNIWIQSRPNNFFDRRLTFLLFSVKREFEKPNDELEPPKSRRRQEEALYLEK